MINDRPIDIEHEWPVPAPRQMARERLAQLIDDPEAAQAVWNAYVAPLYDALAVRAVYSARRRCRICGRSHPTNPLTKGKPVKDHSMWCAHYVGPLVHRAAKATKAPLGWHLLCSCGQTYPDEPNTVCPSAHVDWRGPRP
jgi:hypothetical protein